MTGAIATSYRYNGLGQRVSKTVPGSSAVSRRFIYDEAGHLIGEYDGSGAPIHETVYLGDLPIAVLSGTGGLHYVHADQINTPRAVTDTEGAVVWRWESDPHGVGAPDQDSDGDGLAFVYNLRFPGQYFDQETGLHYNYFRDYDPMIGRYVQSDPIGVEGGLNTYTYVGSNPLSYTDPMGEIAFVPVLIGAGAGYLFDYLLEKYRKENCTCESTNLGASGNTALGSAIGATGPFAQKPKAGIARGGPSGGATSTVSQLNHAAAARGLISVPTRNAITSVARKVPYLGAALAGYELYDAFTCD